MANIIEDFYYGNIEPQEVNQQILHLPVLLAFSLAALYNKAVNYRKRR